MVDFMLVSVRAWGAGLRCEYRAMYTKTRGACIRIRGQDIPEVWGLCARVCACCWVALEVETTEFEITAF